MKVKLFWKKNPVKFRLANRLFWKHKLVTFGSLKRFGPPLTFNDDIDKAASLEDEINAWLLEHPHIKIADIKQSATGGSWGPMLWSISVWYEEGNA
jgi:hypothetical protein